MGIYLCYVLLAVTATSVSGWTVNRATSRMDDTKTVVLARQANETISGWPDKSVVPILAVPHLYGVGGYAPRPGAAVPW